MKTSNELLVLLKQYISQYKTASKAAKSLFVSQSHLSLMINGKRTITARVALRLGYYPVTAYKAIR